MFCPACAASTPAGESICPHCGRPIAAEPLGAAPSSNEKAIRAAGRRSVLNRHPRLRRALLALLPLVAAIGVVWCLVSARAADRNAAWVRAQSAIAAGDYQTALAALTTAEDNPETAPLRAAIAASLPVAQQNYQLAVDRLAAGDDAGAITALQAVLRRLPDDRHASALQAQARAALTNLLRQTLTDGEANENWVAAEIAATQLLDLDPGDRSLAARVAALRRDHAPIVLARDQKLWLVDPLSGDARLLFDAVPATRPVWSPDRSRIAFVAGALARPDDAAALYVINADGSDARRLVANVHPNAVAAWSPDGQQIAYTSVASWDLRRESGILAVHVVDLATGVDRDLTGLSGRHAVTPTWSPDGRFVAVVARDVSDEPGARGLADDGDVETIDVATGAVSDLTRGRLPGVVRVLWSPVAPQILAYARGTPLGESAADPASGLSLERIDVASGEIDTLDRAIFSPAPGWAPAWSPDGAAVAYVDDDGVVTIVRAGRHERIPTGQDLLGEVSWSPDGALLLAPAANTLDSSAIVDPNRPATAPTLLPIAFDTTWPTGTPQWSSPSGGAPRLGAFGAALDP